jgi:putative membrane protein
MTAYYWIKTAHVVFVMAWMGGVFYLPRSCQPGRSRR